MATTNLGRVRFRPRGGYNPAADPLYSLLDLVSDGGGSFVYTNPTPSNEPTSSTSHWQQIASVGGQDILDAVTAEKNAAIVAKVLAEGYAAQLAAGTASPGGTYANLAALNSGTPTAPNTAKIYITLDDGNWCYWNGAAFVAGGVYQAVVVPDQSISPRKTSFFDYSVNLFDQETITDGEYIGGDGVIVSNAGYFVSDYIPITPGKEYVIRNKTFTFQFDSSKNHIWGTFTGEVVYNYVFTAAPGAAYIRVSASHSFIAPSSQVFAEGNKINNSLIKSQYMPQLDSVVHCLFDPDAVTDGIYVSYDGTYVTNASYFTSDYMEVTPGSDYYFNHKTFTAEYDADKNFIASAFTGEFVENFILTTRPMTRYIRFSDAKTALPSVGDFVVTNYSSKIAKILSYSFRRSDSDIIVKVGGTPGTDCDYTKLTDAIAYAYAAPSKNITVRVLAGTYDIISELSSLTGPGPVVGNGMHLIFSPQSYVTCHYTGGDPTIEQTFAPINAGDGDFVIEGINLNCSNTRYCVHDERGYDPAFVRHEYRNCTMYLDNSESSSTYWACIGGGLGENTQIIIDGGHYESATHDPTYGSSITYHNGSTAACKSEIIIKNVYCAGTQAGFRFGYHGVSTSITKCYVSNCSYTVEPAVMQETVGDSSVNMELIEWNNEVRV